MTTSADDPKRTQKALFYLLGFVGGHHVMLLEMCAFRVLGVTFGSSVYVTGTLLTLVMVALSVGYVVGGRASRRFTSLRWLIGSLALCLLYFCLTSVAARERILDWGYAIGQNARNIGGSGARFAMGPLLVTTCLYVIPMSLLSQITPFLVASANSGERRAGVAAGNLMAISTGGSIVGTLLGSFVFLPDFGLGKTHAIFAVTLLALILLALLVERPQRVGTTMLVVAAALSLVSFRAHASANWGMSLVYEDESAYGTLRLFKKQPEDGGKDDFFLLKTSRHSTMSMCRPAAPLKVDYGVGEGAFADVFDAKDVLILGTASGASLMAMQASDPSRFITGVELDPMMIQISERYCGVRPSDHLRMVADDARVFVKTDTHLYDYVIVDLFVNDALPPHCVTEEFFASLRRRMKPNGIVFINFSQRAFEWDTGLTPSTFSARAHLFAALSAAGFPALYEDRSLDQGFVSAFMQDISADEIRARMRAYANDERHPLSLRAAMAQKYFYIVRLDAPDVRPITDDWVPIPQIQQSMYDPPARAAALAAASELPAFRAQIEQDGGNSLRLIGGRHIAAYWRDHHELGVNERPYCNDVRAWIAKQPVYPTAELARYFFETPCLDKPLDSVAADPKVVAFELARRGVDEADNLAPSAVTTLLSAIDATRN